MRAAIRCPFFELRDVRRVACCDAVWGPFDFCAISRLDPPQLGGALPPGPNSIVKVIIDLLTMRYSRASERLRASYHGELGTVKGG